MAASAFLPRKAAQAVCGSCGDQAVDGDFRESRALIISFNRGEDARETAAGAPVQKSNHGVTGYLKRI